MKATVVCIDGVRMKLKPVDADGDGITGEVEDVPSHGSGIMQVQDTTELGQALDHQNKDHIDKTGFSSSDYNARINSFQFSPLVAVDMIATMKVISNRSRDVVRHIMRKSVSVEGKGREEFVDVVVGKMKADQAKASAANLMGTPKQN